jgi:hypothetical protein
LEASSLGIPALDEPSVYPGPTPEYSYLLFGHQVLPLAGSSHRLGRWRVEGSQLSLDKFLSDLGASSLDRRTAVLAFGSNASPPQLARKFSGVPGSAIPVVKGWSYGLQLAFSAHINPVGYIPAAVRATGDFGTRLPVWLTFLDDEQLEVMDPTEPSYHRVTLEYGKGRPVVELESGEWLEAAELYRTKWGVLKLEACEDLGLISQLALRTLLEAQHWSFSKLFASEAKRPASVGLAEVPGLTSLELVAEDGLEGFLVSGSAVYGGIGSYRTDSG